MSKAEFLEVMNALSVLKAYCDANELTTQYNMLTDIEEDLLLWVKQYESMME